MERLSGPQSPCVFIILISPPSALEQIISHCFTGFSLHVEACHEAAMFNVEGNHNAPQVKSSVLFWNTKQLTVSVIKTLAVLYAGLRTSCLKVIREKILFNYSWSDCYRARRKSLETMNWHCLLLFRLISLWMMQFRPSFLENGNSQFSQSANRYQKVAANL